MITGGLKDCAGSEHLNSEGGGRLLSDLTVDGPCFFRFWAHIRIKPRHVNGGAFWFLIRDVYLPDLASSRAGSLPQGFG